MSDTHVDGWEWARNRIELLERELAAANRQAEENLQLAEKTWIDTAITSLRERLASMQTDLAAAVKREREAMAAGRQVADYNLELLTQLADANQRAEAAEADANMWKDAYYGSAPSGAKLRCRKCGDLTEISFHYAKEAVRNG